MSLEKIEGMNSGIDASTLKALEGAKILAGAKYDSNKDNINYSCDLCDCVCNQPCHGEGPCYSL